MTDYDAELQRIQATALGHAIEEMDASAELTVQTREDRGDRGFLTGMAAKSLGVAVRIEQFLALRRGEGDGKDPDARQQGDAAKKLVQSARAEVRGIMERVGAGTKPRS